MASHGPGDSEEAVRVYTTDTIVDNPGAEIAYKGLIICASNTLFHTKRDPDISAKLAAVAEGKTKDKKLLASYKNDILNDMKREGEEHDRRHNVHSDVLAKLTEEAKEKAKKLQANAIVGMKVAETYNSKSNRLEVSIIGTAVHFTPTYTPNLGLI